MKFVRGFKREKNGVCKFKEIYRNLNRKNKVNLIKVEGGFEMVYIIVGDDFEWLNILVKRDKNKKKDIVVEVEMLICV